MMKNKGEEKVGKGIKSAYLMNPSKKIKLQIAVMSVFILTSIILMYNEVSAVIILPYQVWVLGMMCLISNQRADYTKPEWRLNGVNLV